MTSFFWVLSIILLLALAISFAAPAIFVLRRRQLENSMAFSAEFFNLAEKLLEDSDTPDLVISYLETMARIIDDPRFSRMVLVAALTGRLRDATNRPSARAEEIMNAIHSMRKELKDLFARASAACMLSATFKSPLTGVIVRRMTLFSIERDQEQAEIVFSNLYSDGLEPGHAHVRA